MPDDWTFSDLVPGLCGLTPFSPRGFIRDRRSKQEYESNSMQENVNPMCYSGLCSRIVLCPRTRKRASHAAFRVLPALAISDRKEISEDRNRGRLQTDRAPRFSLVEALGLCSFVLDGCCSRK